MPLCRPWACEVLMACVSCGQHRTNIANAARSGDVKKTVEATSLAVKALAEDMGRRLIRRPGKK